MFSALRQIEKNIQDKIVIKHIINDAKNLIDFGDSACDDYFKKNKVEIERLFKSVDDFKRLADANRYIAKKFILHNTNILFSYATTDNDFATLANALCHIKLTAVITAPLLSKMSLAAFMKLEQMTQHAFTNTTVAARLLDFHSFMKLDSDIQSNFILNQSEIIATLFTSVDDIIQFSAQDRESLHHISTSRIDMVKLIDLQPTHILSLFKSCDDFIKLALIDKNHYAFDNCPSIAEKLAKKYADKLMPLFQSANDIIHLAHCKNGSVMSWFIFANKSAVLNLFNGDITLYQRLKDANPATFNYLVRLRDETVKTVKLAEQNTQTKHDPKLFAKKIKHHHTHVNDETVSVKHMP